LLIRKTNPEGFVHQFTYDNLGNIISSIDPNGQVKSFEYNANNKLTKSILPDETLQYAYDLKDQISEVSSSTGNRISYIRDQNDQLITEQNYWNTIGYTNNYSYDANGNRTSVKSTSSYFTAAIFNPDVFTQLNQIFYLYDENNRLKKISNYWGDQFNFAYDQANRLGSITRPGSVTSYIYNSGSQLAEISHDSASIQQSFSRYVYDQRNFITQKETNLGASNYTYDRNGQLTGASESQNVNLNENFTYDEVGNRLSKGLYNYSYDESYQRMQSDGQFVYLYDNNGNILAKNSQSNGTSYHFEYSSTNQVKKIIILNQPLGQAQKTIQYQYDPAGRRISNTITDHLQPVNSYVKKYAYDGVNIIAELDVNNRVLASYTHSPLSPDDVLSVHFTSHAVKVSQGGDAVNTGTSMSYAAGNFYYLKDHLNTVTDIISSTGSIIQKYDYSSFGVLRGLKNSIGQDVSFADAAIKTSFTYTGREFEPETGLYYYRARYYDPSTGRFLQQDPDPGKLINPSTIITKYLYGLNNPIMFSDPTGRFIFLAIFLSSYFIESAIVASVVGGSAAALAAIELSKYNGDTQEMLNKEDPAALVGIALMGSLFSWGGGALSNSFLNSSAGLAMSKTLGIGLTRFATGFVSNALASASMTGIFDITNVSEVSSRDYANALVWGGIAGGIGEFSNWYFVKHFNIPLVTATNGAISISIDYVPKKEKK
jgi:RHS repeat-associated protein